MNNNIKKLNYTDFEEVFDEKLTPYIRNKIKEYDFV